MPLKTLALGGLVVGALDLLDAVVFFGLRSGVRPARILQSIAAGLLGRAAFSGGTQAAALGVFLHFLIAFLIVCSCYAMSRYIPFMTEHVLVSGILFGIGAYVVMNYVVIPLSATSRGAFVGPCSSTAWRSMRSGSACRRCGSYARREIASSFSLGSRILARVVMGP